MRLAMPRNGTVDGPAVLGAHGKRQRDPGSLDGFAPGIAFVVHVADQNVGA